MHRRQFLAALGALGASTTLAPAFAGPVTAERPDARLVVVVLRGGMDGLGAVPAHGDPRYRSVRGDLALPGPGESGGVLDLDGTFGLHPALARLKPLYDAKSLLVAHAVAQPYRERSHFDAQNVLETGADRPHATHSGWLSRALHDHPRSAMAVGKDMPLLLRGPSPAMSLDPLRKPRPDASLYRDVAALYAGDEALTRAIAQGMAAQELLARHHQGKARRGGKSAQSARTVAKMLADPLGPRTAVVSMGGWDTHANQGPRLARQLADLAEVITSFAEASDPAVWKHTVLVAMTEFGRTVAPNGTGGTDHGTGGAAFVAGGAVAGGRVLADWPGLRKSDRLDGRDLRPTLDLRALLKGLLHDHVAVSKRRLHDEVFPGSPTVAPLGGLIA